MSRNVLSVTSCPEPEPLAPDVRNGTVLTLALCERCGTVVAFRDFSGKSFPYDGHWAVCAACGAYRFFYAIRPHGQHFEVRNDRKVTVSSADNV